MLPAAANGDASSLKAAVNAGSPAGRPVPGGSGGSPKAVLSPNAGFQGAVTERLKSLCGEHEDAKVLAEYIVVMVAGNKGSEDMAAELKPFFPDTAQANSFVQWVEDCKWKFLTGGPSPKDKKKGSASNAAASPAGRAEAPSPAIAQNVSGDAWRNEVSSPLEIDPVLASARGRLHPASSGALGSQAAPPPPLPAPRPGPHVAVTSKVVLQPNPSFGGEMVAAAPVREPHAPPPLPASPRARGAHSKAAPSAPVKISTPVKSITSVSSVKPPTHVVKREKNELLENMTRQLQVILTKLNDRGLDDESREKYQALAQNIQTQMAKFKPPTPAKQNTLLRRGR